MTTMLLDNKKTALIAACLGVLLLFTPGASLRAAQSQTADPAPKGDAQAGGAQQRAQLVETPWEVKCTTPPNATAAVCELTKQVLAGKNRQTVLAVIMGIDPKDNTYQMRVLLPHGLSLPDGVSLKIDEAAPRTYPFTTSVAAGVVAKVPVDAALLKAMKAGTKLTVSAKSRGEQDVSLGASLAGFATSLQKLQ